MSRGQSGLFAIFTIAGLLQFGVALAQEHSDSSTHAIHSAHAIDVMTPQSSVQGRVIPVYRFGTGQQQYVFLFAGFHGNEPQGPHILDQLMVRLKQTPAYYAHKSIFVVPRVNPDALAAKRRTNARGVDLNRNFPTQNFVPRRAKDTPYYSGSKALSEPESKVVHSLLLPFVNPENQNKVKILSIHAPYAVNNYDGPAQALAEHMQSLNKYPARADIGYATPGSFGTYYGKERKLQVITLETGKYAPAAAWKKHQQAVLGFLQFPDTELYPVSQPTALPTPVPIPTPLPTAVPTPKPTQRPVSPTGRSVFID